MLESIEENLDRADKVYLFVLHTSGDWLDRVASILSTLEELSMIRKVVLCDFTELTYPAYRRPFWIRHILSVFPDLEVWKPSYRKLNRQSIETDLLPHVVSAVDSVFMSSWRTSERVARSLLQESFKRKASQSFIQTFFATQELLSHAPTNLLAIQPNGRLPAESAIKLAITKWGNETRQAKFLHYEIGITNANFYLQDYAPLDRKSIENDFEYTLPRLGPLEFRAAEDWLESRQNPHTNTNEFAGRFKPLGEMRAGHFDAVFFTSSADEFIGMGPSWNSAWPSQYHAFRKVMQRMRDVGLERFALRFHPNMLNKSSVSFDAELREAAVQLSDFGVQVYGPESDVSSYDLVKASDRVIVSGSTLAMEATHLGVPVWCTGVPYGADCWGARFIHTESQLLGATFETEVSPGDGPMKFVAYLFARTTPINRELVPQTNMLGKAVSLFSSGLAVFMLSPISRLWRLRNLMLSARSVRSMFPPPKESS